MANLFFGEHKNPAEIISIVFSQAEDPMASSIDWARQLLEEKHINPSKSPVTAIKVIREKEPALGLSASTYLVKKLSA